MTALLLAALLSADPATTTEVPPIKYDVVMMVFTMQGCPNCLDAAPKWDAMRREGVNVLAYNVERNRIVFDAFGVSAVPTTIVAISTRDKNGSLGVQAREFARAVGSRPVPEYQAMLKRAKDKLAAGVEPWPADLREKDAAPAR